MKFVPTLEILRGDIQGYGGPDGYYARVIWENVKLEQFTSGDAYDIGLQVAQAKQYWEREWDEAEFKKAIEGKPQAYPICSFCNKPAKSGSSCLSMYWCNRKFCRKTLQCAIDAYQQGDISGASSRLKKYLDEVRTTPEACEVIDTLYEQKLVGPLSEKDLPQSIRLGPGNQTLIDELNTAQSEQLEKIMTAAKEQINLFADPNISRIRCKLNVNRLVDVGSSIRVEMGAVYSSRPDSENKSFSDATPCAHFSMDISKNMPASKAPWLVPGAQVYVDLTLADIPEWNWSGDRVPEEGKRIKIHINDLNSEEHVGIYTRETDEDFLRLANNEYKYPNLRLDDDTRLKLYSSLHNWTTYYWKYV